MFNTRVCRAIGVAMVAVKSCIGPPLCSSVHAEAPRYQVVSPPPQEEVERLELADFYAKYVSAGGIPVISSEKVSDYALFEAAWLIDQMLVDLDDVREALIENKVRFVVMAVDERTTDVPEHSDLNPSLWWDRRARGLGANRERPAVSCGEENLLGYPGDPYRQENILVHEFAHAIHDMGLITVDDTFDRRLRTTYEVAMAAGLWESKYASTNYHEYWAEGVQSWFGDNRENDHQHNHVNTREELIEYDPRLAAIIEEVFGDNDWQYDRPDERETSPHLEGYDPSAAPTFAWTSEEQEVDIHTNP